MSAVLHRRYAWADGLTRGPATITGIAREITTPVAGRTMVLMEQGVLQPRRAVLSGVDGRYTFANIAANTQWVVLGFDPNGAYNMVSADRVAT